MAKQAIKRSLRTRLQRLEAELRPDKGPYLRIGLLRQLPADYTGERHVVIVREGEVEERPPLVHLRGAARAGTAGTSRSGAVALLNGNQMQIIGDPIEE